MTKQEIQQYVYNFLYRKKLPHKVICAIMGNITGESSWDPNCIEVTTAPDKGFGLCQWTFGRRTTLEAYGVDLEHQCEFLWSELTGENTAVTGASSQWISDPHSSVDNGEGFYCKLSTFLAGDKTLEYLTKAFCYCWERPAYETNHLQETRIPSANDFYSSMTFSDFKIRDSLSSTWPTSDPIRSYYGDGNPYHRHNLGMWTVKEIPRGNCTAYAWGRVWEIRNNLLHGLDSEPVFTSRPEISIQGAAYTWYDYAVENKTYPVDKTPRRGDVICWENTNTPGEGGHVAVVEDVDLETGDIICSNSAWEGYPEGLFFYTSTMKAANNYNDRHYKFLGFIHVLDDIDIPLTPVDPVPLVKYGVYIKNKFYHPVIYNKGKGIWEDAIPKIYDGKSKSWKSCIR